MSKWYEVAITAHKVVVIEVEDDHTEDEVCNFAIDYSDFDSSSVAEIEIEQLSPERLDCAKRYADKVAPL